MKTLHYKAFLALAALTLVMGLLLFGAAGTLRYWPGWAYLALFSGASLLTTLYLMNNDPELLARRMRGGPTAEKQPAQRLIMLFTSAGFIALMVVPGLDHRFAWSTVPLGAVIAGDALVALGFAIIFRVYKENTFSAATIDVFQGQKVISTGPYRHVRHPMYAGASLYLLGTPLALGSYWGLIACAATLPFLLWRLFAEEAFLQRNLPGYDAYRKLVRWRLLPGVF